MKGVSSDDLLNTPTANVTQAIAGKIPGVVTTQVSGAPGADDATINIRGRATFAGDGAPLVMVGHLEMIGAIVYQLTRNLTQEQIKQGGFDAYFVNHTTGVYPAGANGVPFNAGAIASKGDVITNLHENMAAEQKARTTYDNILRLVDDPDVRDVIKFLREREVVHYQRFGEGLRIATDKMNEKNFYAFNPSFDTVCNKKTR